MAFLHPTALFLPPPPLLCLSSLAPHTPAPCPRIPRPARPHCPSKPPTIYARSPPTRGKKRRQRRARRDHHRHTSGTSASADGAADPSAATTAPPGNPSSPPPARGFASPRTVGKRAPLPPDMLEAIRAFDRYLRRRERALAARSRHGPGTEEDVDSIVRELDGRADAEAGSGGANALEYDGREFYSPKRRQRQNRGRQRTGDGGDDCDEAEHGQEGVGSRQELGEVVEAQEDECEDEKGNMDGLDKHIPCAGEYGDNENWYLPDLPKLYTDKFDDEGGRVMPQHVLNCVVKIYCTHSTPNFAMPWSLDRQTQSTSSGFVISGRRVITCAHCVEHHTVVMVKRRGNDTRYPATVVAIGNECDIALLAVEDPEFWKMGEDSSEVGQTSPQRSAKEVPGSYLKPGRLPDLQDHCAVVGYPTGGTNLSITQGVCSRIEMQGYVYATSELLAVQLDAAINSGNSGGPVINDRCECVGVAFQSIDPREADSIGYLVPYTVVQHFLDDIERHGKYTGFPATGFRWQRMESECMRRALSSDHPNVAGVLVKSVDPTSDAVHVLRRGDIVTHMDGVAISNAGTVPFAEQPGERICLTYLVTSRFVGEVMRLSIVRDSEPMEVVYILPAMGSARLVPVQDPRDKPDRLPEYIVHGGLVFVTLSENYLRSEYEENWVYDAPVRLVEQHYHGKKLGDGRSEIVLLAHVLNAKTNAGYEDVRSCILRKFNSTVVKSLAHLAELLNAAEDDGSVQFLRFELDHDELLILDKEKSASELPSILKTHCIPKARHISS